MRTKAHGAVEKHICGMLLNLMLLCETVTVILFQLRYCNPKNGEKCWDWE